MELSPAVYHTSRIIRRHNFPRIVNFLDAHPVIGLLRTEIVECRERQRKGILVVVEIKLLHTNQRLIKYDLSIIFLACTNTITVNHQSHQFRIELEVHL